LQLTCGNGSLSTETIDTGEGRSDVVEGNRRNGNVTGGSPGENCSQARKSEPERSEKKKSIELHSPLAFPLNVKSTSASRVIAAKNAL
jgi:hypothetical protein